MSQDRKEKAPTDASQGDPLDFDEFDDPFEGMYTAVHEAGHVVAGMGLGFESLDVRVRVRADGTGVVEGLLGPSAQTIADVRRKLIFVVTGRLAECLHEADDWGRAARDSHCLLSLQLRNGPLGDEDDGSDAAKALFLAREVCRRLKLQDAGSWEERRVRDDVGLNSGYRADVYWERGPTVAVRPLAPPEEGDSIVFAGPVTPPEVTSSELLAEVVRAERWAERLLRRRWQAVTAVAKALYRSKNGTLTEKRVLALIAAADRPSRSRPKSSGS